MAKSKAYLVSGSGSGIGLAISQLLVQQGHWVFGLGRDATKLKSAAETMTPGQFSYAAFDLATPKAAGEVAVSVNHWLEQENLQLNGVINNAGIFDRAAFHLTTDAIWERQFQNNLMSAVRLTREFYPILKNQSGSSVLNISSTLGHRPILNTSAYSALKAAMINWTKALALEWAPDHIRVNCICPGIVDTPIHDFHYKTQDDPARIQAHAAQPLGRMGQPSDIATAAAFLLSSDSSWTTGSVLTIDGGIGL